MSDEILSILEKIENKEKDVKYLF